VRITANAANSRHSSRRVSAALGLQQLQGLLGLTALEVDIHPCSDGRPETRDEGKRRGEVVDGGGEVFLHDGQLREVREQHGFWKGRQEVRLVPHMLDVRRVHLRGVGVGLGVVRGEGAGL